MSQKTECKTSWVLASFALRDAYTDFMLSRQSIQCSPSTLSFYEFTAGKFLTWLEKQGITTPGEVTARLVRAYTAELTMRKLSDTYIHSHARVIRTLLRFWHAEGYMPDVVQISMPKIAKKRLPVLSAEEVGKVLSACNVRDKAIILLMVDTGLRLSEVVALDWQDVDLSTGLTRIVRGKGGKARSVVLGATTRRALLAYRRTLGDVANSDPLIKTEDGMRFVPHGLRSVFCRLAQKSGIPFSAHALRRTFTILSLRAGMDVLHLQALLGHATLAMVYHYAQMVDEDLLTEHRAHSPVDNLSRLAKK